jgi:hypothetical protein
MLLSIFLMSILSGSNPHHEEGDGWPPTTTKYPAWWLLLPL